MDPLWRPLARRPSAVLLAVQLIGVLLYPFLDGPGGRALLSVFGILVLFLAVRTVQATPALTWVAIGLGLPIVLLSAVEVIDPDNARVGLATSILFAAFYGYTSYALIRYMFNDRVVTNDELYATGATFTVVAWGFAYAYVAIAILQPGAFSGASDPTTPQGWFEMLFLSFTNLTSVGLSDILPVSPQARSIVMIEQVAGLLYIALVVSRVVGLTIVRQRELQEESAGPDA